MSTEITNVSVDELANGGIAALLNYEFEGLVASIADPQIEAEKTRTITVTIKAKPNKQRTHADLSFSSRHNFPSRMPILTSLGIQYDSVGRAYAHEITGQLEGQITIEGDELRARRAATVIENK